MEDHMTLLDKRSTGRSSVTTATDSMESDPNLCDRVKILEQKAGSAVQPESYLRNRIRQLERSERSLLLQLCQLASASHLPSMQHTQRLDQRLHMLREEVRTMTREKEQVDQVWRERLQRCQRQLKTKEEEMSRQSQYFENFKAQLQHKLSLAHNREQGLQSRISTLEKQLLDLTVSAATGTAAISAVRITAGTSTHWEEQERLTFMRGQGEGEEEKKEEIKKQWWPSVRIEREGGRAGDKGKTEKETEGGRNKDTRQNSNEARLQGFILSLQEDLRVLLEREEDGMTERRQLTEQLQEAQENSHFLSCKVEDMKAEVHQLKLSEHSLMEEVEQLRQKNHRLQQILREAANQTTSQSSAIPESTCLSPGPSSPSCSISKKVQPKSDDEIDQSHSPAVPPGHHQATAEATQNNTENHSSSAKSDPLKLSANQGSKPNPSFQSLTLTTETTDELTLGTWFSRGFINLQNSPSEESDALREAYRSLGLQEDLEALHEQGEAAMQHIQEQLQMMAQENSQLKLQLRKQAEEEEAEAQQGLSREKINSSSTCDGADHLQSSSIQDETILALAQNDLVQALNQENRALADRIQELLAHIELREEEMKTEESELKNHVSRLEEDRARLEQENQEQGCLITELTRKTEDDLNTIMELQQQLEKSGEQCNLEECIDSLVENVLKGAEPQLISSQQTDDLTTGSAPGFQHKNHYDPLQNSPQNTLHVSSSADQVDQLTKSIQTLKREQEELSGCINDLREQQREVALSVQTQTEEKQQLTRTVWGLKEEKDSISQSLAGLKQEREELNRIVCVLKDERDHFIRSMSGLKEEKEQLTKALSGLQREKEAMIESLSSGKEERDQIMQSVQGLQTENDQLKQAVLNLKQERDHLTDSLKCLKDQRDQEHSCYTLQEQCDKLMKSVSSLGEEKESIEYSVHCLRQEEKQMMLIIQGLREERNSLQTATGTGEYGNSLQEQRDLVREIEEELEKSQVEVKKMDNELCQSEVRRVEAERKATQAAEKVMRLTDVANQMEETRKENERLNSQVKELQSKLIGLTREMSDALSLKIHIEEQYSVLTAQLKAKTVALEELNSEYIALKQGQGSKDDLSTALTSLRTHYNDIRAKYDALLKRKSQTDVDIAPLKAKLSCLVVKCQERNSLLLQLMKAMHRQGCVDSVLTQQVEQLLRDAALQDYSAAFTPGSNVNTQDCSTGFIPGFVSKFQDFTSGFTPDQTCSAVLPSVNKHHQTGFNSESDIKYRESGKHTSIVTSESTTNFQVCSHEITPTPIRAPKKNANSSVPNSPVKEQPSVQVSPSPVIPLKEGLSRNTTQQLSPSASGPVQATSGQKTFGFHDPNMKEKSSPDLTGLTESSLTSSPLPSSTHISPSRRLSSPEKIINLHEQLQKTLMSSYQVPVSRGRDRQSRKSLSFSAPADLSLASQTQKQNLSFSNPHNSLPVSTASSQSIHTSVVTAKPVATNKSATLFNAVASRSAHIEFSPNMFTSHHIKANMSKPTTSACSSSSNFPFATVTPSKAKSILSSDTNISVSPKPTKKITAIPDASYASHTSSIPLTLRPPGFDSNVLMFSDTNSKSTASDTAAFSISAVPKVNIFNMTSTTDDAPAYHGFVSAASCTQSAHRSPERPNKSARESTAALEKTKSARPKAEAPAEVRSVEVIKTVGQSSLMIGWERPPLDELGCSNGTFVYGYRVLIDGEFHKSVMSSACTKCILENVDLNVPVHISVQTLGSNGLSSNSVHTEYRTSVRTDQH